MWEIQEFKVIRRVRTTVPDWIIVLDYCLNLKNIQQRLLVDQRVWFGMHLRCLIYIPQMDLWNVRFWREMFDQPDRLSTRCIFTWNLCAHLSKPSVQLFFLDQTDQVREYNRLCTTSQLGSAPMASAEQLFLQIWQIHPIHQFLIGHFKWHNFQKWTLFRLMCSWNFEKSFASRILRPLVRIKIQQVGACESNDFTTRTLFHIYVVATIENNILDKWKFIFPQGGWFWRVRFVKKETVFVETIGPNGLDCVICNETSASGVLISD